MRNQRRTRAKKPQAPEKEDVQEKKKYKLVLQIIVISMIMLVAIFIGNTIRKFYIFNTYMAVTNEYSTKDNYKKILIQYEEDEVGFAVMGYKKGDKTLVKMYSEDNTKTISYYDKKKQESITKVEVGKDKVAFVKQEDEAPVLVSSVAYIESFTEISAWQNFLLALHSKIVSETYKGKECYKITAYGDLEQWVDKETGLIVRQSGGYYQSKDGTMTRIYHEYNYQFGIVTDEDVKKPDLTGYKIEKQ